VLYGYGMYRTMSGDLTGRGPSDPQLRKEWLATHQPYSIKIGGNWYSYAKVEPLSIPLGLMADLHVVLHELDDKNTDVSDLMYAVPTAIFYNLSSSRIRQASVSSSTLGLTTIPTPRNGGCRTWRRALRSHRA